MTCVEDTVTNTLLYNFQLIKEYSYLSLFLIQYTFHIVLHNLNEPLKIHPSKLFLYIISLLNLSTFNIKPHSIN